MTKKYNQTIVMLAFCSAFTDFLIDIPYDIFYPRERIIHIIISAFVFMFIACVVNVIDFKSIKFKYTACLLIVIRMIYIAYGFSSYFRMFYGNNTVGVSVFTVIVLVTVFRMKDNNISQIGGFYIIANIIMMLMIFIVSSDKVCAANIYSLNTDLSFSLYELFILFDIFTISILSANKASKWQNQKKFITLYVSVFIIITLIQGFCIKGDLLYRLSPLQALLQILSGNTVKRYDYILNLFFIFNYFGAIVLYTTAVRKLLNSES